MNAGWIPNLLIDEQKRTCVANANKLLKMYPKFNKKAFHNFVTIDETWVYYFEAKQKSSNRIWANNSKMS
jgi:hypothetical protein